MHAALAVGRTHALSSWPAVDSSGWSEPFDAFPVEAPFTVKPDLVKLAPTDDWLRVDRDWSPMLAAKLAARTGGADFNHEVASPCDDRVARRRLAALTRAIDSLAVTADGRRLGLRTMEDRFRFEAAGYCATLADGRIKLQAERADAAAVVAALGADRFAGGGGGRSSRASSGSSASSASSASSVPCTVGNSLRLLGALAMSLQEDLVLMEQDAHGAVRAALLQVSFPSAWDPAAKVGQDLFALHAPVADNARLQAAAGRLGGALVAKGPYVRWVWTVTDDPRWRAWPPPQSHDRSPSRTRGPESGPLYFRLERQSTMPLGEGYCLFLIRVQVRPLEEVTAQPGRLALLQASLRSMSDAMVRYKNLGAVRERLTGVA